MSQQEVRIINGSRYREPTVLPTIILYFFGGERWRICVNTLLVMLVLRKTLLAKCLEKMWSLILYIGPTQFAAAVAFAREMA